MKKGFGKRFWINLVVIIVVGIFSGYFVGNFYVNRYMGGVKADVLPSEEAIRDNVNTVLKKNKGKSPSQISATDNMILAEYYLNQRDYVKRSTYGDVKAAGVTQKLVSNKALVNGEYYSEEISQGMVNLATKYYHTKGSNTVSVYKGSVDKELNTNYDDVTPNNMSVDDFNAQNGVKATYFLNYIVSSNTVIAQNYVGKSKVGATVAGREGRKYDKELYVFTLTLDNSYSVKNYMYKIKQTSNSSEFPGFKSIELTFMIDDDFTLYEISYNEVYNVNIAVLGQVTTTGKIIDLFDYDNSFVIPR